MGARLLAQGSPRPLFEAQLATEEAALGAATGMLLVGMTRASRRPRLARLERLGVVPLVVRAAMTNAARDVLGELAVIPEAARSRRPGVPPQAVIAAMGRLAHGVRTPQRIWIDHWVRALAPVDDWPGGTTDSRADEVLHREVRGARRKPLAPTIPISRCTVNSCS